jgi:hypothetical protein
MGSPVIGITKPLLVTFVGLTNILVGAVETGSINLSIVFFFL